MEKLQHMANGWETLFIDITLALAGASAAKVAKYLSKTGRGNRILNILNKYKKPAMMNRIIFIFYMKFIVKNF